MMTTVFNQAATGQLNINRKRGRIQEDEEELPNEEMQVDEDSLTRGIFELNDKELDIAQTIAQERIKSTLFIHVDIPSLTDVKNDILVTNSPSDGPSAHRSATKERQTFCFGGKITSDKGVSFQQQSTSSSSAPLRTPNSLKTFHFGATSNFASISVSPVQERSKTAEMVSSVCSLILKQGNGSPSKLTYALDMTQRSWDILETLRNNENTSMIGQEDTMDLFRILVFLLHQFGNVLPQEIHAACQGVLAINQVTGLARRVGGTSVKSPTSMVKGLLRNILILVPKASRKVLNDLIEFTCEFSQRASSRLRNVWAKQLSIVFGHALEEQMASPNTSTPSKGATEASWKALFFELLIHSHGLHSETYVSLEKKELWSIDDEFNQELKKRYQLMQTPARKGKVGMTPRRSVNRIGMVKSMSGQTLKRNLFKSSNKSPFLESLNVPSLHNFIPCGSKSPAANTADFGNGMIFDRETFSKRLRLKLREELFVAFTSLNLISGLNRNIQRKVSSFLEGLDQPAEQFGDEYIFLELLARYYTELQSFDSYLEQKEVIGAAASCRELKSFIERLAEIESRDKNIMPEEIYQIVEEQYLLRHSFIIALHDALAEEFFSFNTEEISIKNRVLYLKNNLRFHDTPVDLVDFLSMVDVLELATSFNANLVQKLFVSSDWDPSSSQRLFQSTRSSQPFILSKQVISAKDASTEADITAANLQELAIFITTCIFPAPHCPDDYFLSAWNLFILKRHDILLGCSLQSLESLQTTLIDTGMMSDSIEPIFRADSTCERRLDLLYAVKDIVRSKDFNSISVCEVTERGGITKFLNMKGSTKIPKAFELPSLTITQRTERLIDLIYCTLADLSLPCCVENADLVQMARDALDIYRLECPELSADDRDYICHHLITLTILCKDYLPPTDCSPSFLDSFPFFRK